MIETISRQIADGLSMRRAVGMTRMLAALYRAKGRILNADFLMDVTAPLIGEDDRYPEIIKVWVCRSRKALGADAIESVRFEGYRMTAAGRSKIDALITEHAQ